MHILNVKSLKEYLSLFIKFSKFYECDFEPKTFLINDLKISKINKFIFYAKKHELRRDQKNIYLPLRF